MQGALYRYVDNNSHAFKYNSFIFYGIATYKVIIRIQLIRFFGDHTFKIGTA